ncbi:hypothetical protein A0H81_10196 [Grifola frondosa]|uniref:NAD(P)-binding domain-containing protein n=1 Tax=Grifola frondosa TaxID=5627 RepID=A0A1C7LZI9_GRIFR|nr:hypothetical protein A0H81_10196 [Grifola frondosa]
MKAFVIGGSRNIGYYAAVRLLNQGATVTFLLRYPDDNSVDLVLFTVGAREGKVHLTRGFIIDIPDLCTKSLVNVLSTTPPTSASSSPRFITISSIGVTRAAHAKLPFLLRLLYAFLLREPHADKLGAERVAAHVAGWEWRDEEPIAEVLGANWQNQAGLPEQGQLKHFLVVRPALLTNGECQADKAGDKTPYRVIYMRYLGITRNLGHGLLASMVAQDSAYITEEIHSSLRTVV